MKKMLTLLLVVMMMLLLSACGENQPTEPNKENDQVQTTNNVDMGISNDIAPPADVSANSIEALEGIIEKYVENIVNTLNAEWETLAETITTYTDYEKNAEKIEQFYERIILQSEQSYIGLQEYAIKYAEMIMSSNMSNDDKYDASMI